eukprot:gene2709-3128_t
MKLKTGKDEIVYLLTKVFKKYEISTGLALVLNTNRKNYEELAKVLSKISNELPNTSQLLRHDPYPPERNTQKLEYPYLKYDITGGQIKDAYTGMVSNPRPFLIDACYIYLYGTGRKGFQENPVDQQLLEKPLVQPNHSFSRFPLRKMLRQQKKASLICISLLFLLLMMTATGWFLSHQNWENLKKDLKILPYYPSKAEIDHMEGLWMVYIGSPQARSSDSSRYHMAVTNMVDVRFKNGYFTFNRYGANFNHSGYMQFENKDLLSIHSYLKNNTGKIESPRLSLMRLDRGKKDFVVLSTSWNFEAGNKNDLIGIREVYVKLGKGGQVEEIINTLDNSSCKCKIIRWEHQGQHQDFYLKNIFIDSLKDLRLKTLLDENSILLREPGNGIILRQPAGPVH